MSFPYSPYPSDYGVLKIRNFMSSTTSNGKWTCSGTIFNGARHGRHRSWTVDVRVPAEGTYLASISLTMLYPYGGDYDNNDVVFADIPQIDGNPTSLAYILPPGAAPDVPYFRSFPVQGHGGAFGGLLGDIHRWPSFNPRNMGISAWTGGIQQSLTFRLAVNGDDLAAATFVIHEL